MNQENHDEDTNQPRALLSTFWTPDKLEECYGIGRSGPVATPMTATLLARLLVEKSGHRKNEVAAAIARVVSGGLEISEQPDGDHMLSEREVRIVIDELDSEIDWAGQAYHWECCPKTCDAEEWHDSETEAKRLGYVEHGSNLARAALPEIRRTPSRITRPDQGRWTVGFRQRIHILDPRRRVVDGVPSNALVEDEVVVLVHQDPDEVGTARGREIRLLDGEALVLADALTSAVRKRYGAA